MVRKRSADGATDHPDHDEDRARREFRLLTADEARDKARERLRCFLADHPGIVPTPRRER